MATESSNSPAGSPAERPRERLESWKEIAAYLNRTVRTVHRWEKEEALPVRRHLHKKQGTVYAYTHEIDAWREHRRAKPPPRRRIGRGTLVGILVTAATALAIAGYRWLPDGVAPEPANDPRLMLAVLPFEDAGTAPDEDYFAEGLTDELITELGKLAPAELGVIARNSVMRYREAGRPAREIGEELGLDYIVYGRLRRTSSRIHANVELMRVDDLTRAWGETYDRPIGDLAALRDDIVRAIAREIRIGGTAVSRRETSPESHRLFLQGRYYANKRTRPDIERAIGLLEQAIRVDPRHARAYAELADLYSMQAYYGISSPAEAQPKAREFALTALQLDSTLAEGHTVLATIFERWDWNWQEAEQEFRLALDLNPNYARAHHLYGLFLERMGRLPEAAVQMEQAMRLDPVSLIIIKNVADVHYFAGRYEQAIRRYRQALEMEPDFYIAHLFLGFAWEQSGNIDRAIDEFQLAMAADDDPAIVAALAHAHALAGRTQEARRWLDELNAVTSRYVSPYHLAVVYTALQRHDEAFEQLDQAYAMRDEWLLSILTDPRLAALRPDPRYADLLARMSLPASR